jgi:SPOR domain
VLPAHKGYVMGKGEPKEVELEEELDFLYRKVSSRDQSDDVFYLPHQLKAETLVSEEPALHDETEKWPLPRREGRKIRSSRIAFTLLPVLILGLMAVFYWPLIYHYDALNSEGKVYPLRINRVTGEAAYFDGAYWLRPPIPAERKDTVPGKQIAQAAVVIPTEANQTKAAAAPPNTGNQLRYAIQIRAFPENMKNAAARFVDDMKKKLPDVRMETVDIQGRGIWHRILLGNFSTMAEAASYMKEAQISRAFRDSFVQKKSAGES